MYLPTPIVFTIGVAHEADLTCRIPHMPKALFA
jgi:hypothetical protein